MAEFDIDEFLNRTDPSSREGEKPFDIDEFLSRQPQPEKADAPSWGDVPLSAVKNLPKSAYNFGHDLIQPIIHPIDTAKSIYEIGRGAMQKLGVASGEESIPAANAVGQFLVDRYGSLDAIKNTLATDPVGIAADLSTVLSGGAGAAARVPGLAGKTTAAVSAAARAIDPLSAAAKGAGLAGKGAAQAIGHFGTHTGPEALEAAAKAGYAGGEAGQIFRENMRGNAPMEDVVKDARNAVSAMGAERGATYRQGMAELAKDQTVLNFDKVDNALAGISQVSVYKGQSLAPKTQAIRQEIGEAIRDWKYLDPVEFHTAEGLDALKRKIGDIRDATQYGTPERAVANRTYHALRDTIVEQAPEYAKIMKGYEEASKLIKEMERTLSLDPTKSVDTALRKLQSTLRNNVNTNYGHRLKLVEYLQSAGAPHLMEALAGQALSSWAPRGLGKLVGSAVLGHTAMGVTGAGVGALGTLPFMSPRLMGEAAHGAGWAAGHLPLRAGPQAAFQTGRASDVAKEGFARGGHAKPSKAQTHYRLGSGNKRCEICTMFRAPHTCTAIVGKVSKIGLCDLFERKPAYAEGGEVTDSDDSPFERAAARARARYLGRNVVGMQRGPAEGDVLLDVIRTGIADKLADVAAIGSGAAEAEFGPQYAFTREDARKEFEGHPGLARQDPEPPGFASRVGSETVRMGLDPTSWVGPGGVGYKAAFNALSGLGGETAGTMAAGTKFEPAARFAGSFTPAAVERALPTVGRLVPQGSLGAFGSKMVIPGARSPRDTRTGAEIIADNERKYLAEQQAKADTKAAAAQQAKAQSAPTYEDNVRAITTSRQALVDHANKYGLTDSQVETLLHDLMDYRPLSTKMFAEFKKLRGGRAHGGRAEAVQFLARMRAAVGGRTYAEGGEVDDELLPPPYLREPQSKAGPALGEIAAQPFRDMAKGLGSGMTEDEAKNYFMEAMAGLVPMGRAAKPAARALREAVAEVAPGAAGLARTAPEAAPRALFDYSRIGELPDVPQFDLPRYNPKHGVSDRVADLIANKKVRQQTMDYLERGHQSGAGTFYGTQPLREAFVEELGRKEGPDAFRRYMEFVGGSSPRSTVPENARNASYYYVLDRQGQPMPVVGSKNEQPYGHLAQRLHQRNAQTIAGPGWDVFKNPKPPSFIENLAGNWQPVTVDAHAFKLPGMVSKDPRFLAGSMVLEKGQPPINPSELYQSGDLTMKQALQRPAFWASKPNANEYAAMENYWKGMARDLGYPAPAYGQASGWSGGGELTGLKSVSAEPFLRAVENRVILTAAERGITPAEALSQFMRGKAPLLSGAGAAGLGTLASQDRRDEQ